MKVSLIAAVAENGVIGREGGLPWRIRDDMRFFVRTTRGHTVVMGRLNYDSMGKSLPRRRNIVITRNSELTISGCEMAASLQEALRLANLGDEKEVFVIGGSQIYALAAPYAHRYYRTRVLAAVPGNVVFPELDFRNWAVEKIEEHGVDEDNEYPFVVELLTRLSEPKSYE